MPLTCTVAVDGLCGQPAVAVMRITRGDRTVDFPRCADHDAQGYAKSARKVYPDARVEVLPLPEPQERLHGDSIEIIVRVPGSDMAPVGFVRRSGQWLAYAPVGDDAPADDEPSVAELEGWERHVGSVELTDATIGAYLTGLIARHVELGTGGLVLEDDGSQ